MLAQWIGAQMANARLLTLGSISELRNVIVASFGMTLYANIPIKQSTRCDGIHDIYEP